MQGGASRARKLCAPSGRLEVDQQAGAHHCTRSAVVQALAHRGGLGWGGSSAAAAEEETPAELLRTGPY